MNDSRRVPVLLGRHQERGVVNRLLETVRGEHSRALVLRGEPGVGKTALLDYMVEQAGDFRVVRAAGVQAEMELVYAGLHQLCAPLLGRLPDLPSPQREVLRTVFGIAVGLPPDRFLVSLAVLNLLSASAEERPLLCIVDDEQWLDRGSAQALAFVARRLRTELVGLVFASRAPGGELGGMPELVVDGLAEDDARALLDSALTGPLDAQVCDQIISETRGNPLAILELPRGLTPAELAGGFALPGVVPLAGRIEESFLRRLDALPADARRLLQLAAADPVGDSGLVWRAADLLGIPVTAAISVDEAGLLEIGVRVRFRHPLVRSAVYRSATLSERQIVHRALAEVTDPHADPDRRAWHRAHASVGPDEGVAQELERSAGRAQARGGLAAAAAFLERAATLTPNADRRAQRLLAAARAKRDVGALDAALGLLVAVEAGSSTAMRTAEVGYLRGQIALMQGRPTDAARLLLEAARRQEPLKPDLARETHLEALGTALWAGDLETRNFVLEAAKAALAAPVGSDPPRAVDVLLDAFALRVTEGYRTAAPVLKDALGLALAPTVPGDELGRWLWLTAGRAGAITALELWDAESAHTLASRLVDFARNTGAVARLQFALNTLAWTHLVAGELTTAELLIDEDLLISDATGNPRLGNAEATLLAWRGHETADAQINAIALEAKARGLGRTVDFATYASSVLNNGLGRHEVALDAALRALERDQMGYGPFVVPELAEAAYRTGDVARVWTTLDWLSERTQLAPTDWVLGIEARIRATLSDGDAAEGFYRESIGYLSRTRVRVELARSHLVYGEWLRRERRRVDARTQLRTAYEMLDGMGIAAFAERARRELLATGVTARKRSAGTGAELTAQESQIASLARGGLSNPEIGVRLFISPRTVKYHLRKVYTKLGITARGELAGALPAEQSSDRSR